jgi:tRNA pseudouridine13 synthase
MTTPLFQHRLSERVSPPSPRFATDAAGEGEVSFRPSADDFVVEEIAAYQPSGSGDHWYVWVEKRGLSTPALVKHIAEALRINTHDIGVAGNKDEVGTTRQWLSIPQHNVDAHNLPMPDNAKVLQVSRHNNKLRMGHLHGNRFTVRLVGKLDQGDLQQRIAVLADEGFANAFGWQRFGHDGRTLDEAQHFLHKAAPAGLPARTRRERFWVSAVQSAIFNRWLQLRVDAGLAFTPVDGDVLLKCDNHAPFRCDDIEADRARCEQKLVAPGGPLHGRHMRSAAREAMTWESRSASDLGIDLEQLLQHKAFDMGDRRIARAWPQAPTCTHNESHVELAFGLRSGCYATIFLHHLIGKRLRDEAHDVG